MSEGQHQRRRSRPRRERPDEPQPRSEPRPRPPEPRGELREAERTLRSLVGAGPSQLSLQAAMRARDASRPTDADLAEAEAEVTVIRRQYVPTESLPPGVRPAKRPGSRQQG